jgi:hypothetical protein
VEDTTEAAELLELIAAVLGSGSSGALGATVATAAGVRAERASSSSVARCFLVGFSFTVNEPDEPLMFTIEPSVSSEGGAENPVAGYAISSRSNLYG